MNKTIYNCKVNLNVSESSLLPLVFVTSDDEARSGRAFLVLVMLEHSLRVIPLLIERGAVEGVRISLFDMRSAFSYPDNVVWITIGIVSLLIVQNGLVPYCPCNLCSTSLASCISLSSRVALSKFEIIKEKKKMGKRKQQQKGEKLQH